MKAYYATERLLTCWGSARLLGKFARDEAIYVLGGGGKWFFLSTPEITWVFALCNSVLMSLCFNVIGPTEITSLLWIPYYERYLHDCLGLAGTAPALPFRRFPCWLSSTQS